MKKNINKKCIGNKALSPIQILKKQNNFIIIKSKFKLKLRK